jgi:hypothetical protein
MKFRWVCAQRLKTGTWTVVQARDGFASTVDGFCFCLNLYDKGIVLNVIWRQPTTQAGKFLDIIVVQGFGKW